MQIVEDERAKRIEALVDRVLPELYGKVVGMMSDLVENGYVYRKSGAYVQVNAC